MAKTVTFVWNPLSKYDNVAPIKMPDMANGSVRKRAALIQLFKDAIYVLSQFLISGLGGKNIRNKCNVTSLLLTNLLHS